MTDHHEKFMRHAIALARKGVETNSGGPFGAVVVKDGEIIAEGWNCVTSENDPTAHAEIVAIRKACKKLGAFQLVGCVLYTTCEPCPMCMGAIYWARPEKVFFACTREDAASIGFDDKFIYHELEKDFATRELPIANLLRDEAFAVFKIWEAKPDKIEY